MTWINTVDFDVFHFIIEVWFYLNNLIVVLLLLLPVRKDDILLYKSLVATQNLPLSLN